MSWFKRSRNETKTSRASSDTGSTNSIEAMECRSRRDTDPDTCLEVFTNHWGQASAVINSKQGSVSPQFSVDEVEAVSQNFEQMITLLVDEEGVDGTGMPGPILHYLLEHNILEKFCAWCHQTKEHSDKLLVEQLRMFEHLISRSTQVLLIHKPVIRPLLNLLAFCADGFQSKDIEKHLVLVLHQICACISKETVILESFFNMSADHGPAKFLIFSLLIPFLHKEGPVGQQARDALLLIMALSAKHPHIGGYIAENSDFCPVLATGLSGLYSALPRKISIPSDDWHRVTEEDIARMPEMTMFLNSLEFCNAVVQIRRSVRDSTKARSLAEYRQYQASSREEVITTTSYLELFLRKVTEPSLIKAFLKFILLEKNDEIIILDSLITRISSSSRLCLVSLSLFHTLVDLNCEDVMFQLVLKYLLPCTHVMVSQRRSVKDLDMYSRSAEKFLSLRPTCCLPELSESPQHGNSLVEHPRPSPIKTNMKMPAKKFFGKGKKLERRVSEVIPEPLKTAFPPGSLGSKLEHFETSYMEYLQDARLALKTCATACQDWSSPYDGDLQRPSSCDSEISDEGNERGIFGTQTDRWRKDSESKGGDLTKNSSKNSLDSFNVNKPTSPVIGKPILSLEELARGGNPVSKSVNIDICDKVQSSSGMLSSGLKQTNLAKQSENVQGNSRYDDLESFMNFLNESGSPLERSASFEESIKSLDSLLCNISALSMSRTSTPMKVLERRDEVNKTESTFRDQTETGSENDHNGNVKQIDVDVSKIETTAQDLKPDINSTAFEVIDVSKPGKSEINGTAFEIIDNTGLQKSDSTQEQKSEPNSKTQNATSFVEITMSGDASSSIAAGRSDAPPNISDGVGGNEKEMEQAGTTYKGDKFVRFAASVTSMQSSDSSKSSSQSRSFTYSSNQSNIGPFLTALLSKLETMMQNSLPVNLMLTGLVARLAAFPQPLLRSFLLNHNLVFQPTVKSLVQVITSVRQKVDHFSYTVQNFEQLLLRARRTLATREGLLPERGKSQSPSPEIVHPKTRALTVPDLQSKEKRHRTLSELLFRRSPAEKKAGGSNSKKSPQLEMIPGKGFRYINRKMEEVVEGHVESLKTRQAVYCALVLEEFVKELAALTQEHTVLCLDDGYCSS